jgi:hypothetical protein
MECKRPKRYQPQQSIQVAQPTTANDINNFYPNNTRVYSFTRNYKPAISNEYRK